MQKVIEKLLGLRIDLTPIHLCNDMTNMRNIYVVYFSDMTIVVIVGGYFIVHCCDKKFSPCFLANILHDVAFADDVLNQAMDRYEISCWIVIVISIDVDVVSGCPSNERKLNQNANRLTDSISISIQMQSRRL